MSEPTTLIEYVDKSFGPGTGKKAEELSHEIAKVVYAFAKKDGEIDPGLEALAWNSVVLALGARLSMMSDTKGAYKATCRLLADYAQIASNKAAELTMMDGMHGGKLHVVN